MTPSVPVADPKETFPRCFVGSHSSVKLDSSVAAFIRISKSDSLVGELDRSTTMLDRSSFEKQY
jgi:hypothetical protein